MDKITDVIKTRSTLQDFLTMRFDDFALKHPEVDIIVYFNTVALLLKVLKQTFMQENKFITDIDGQWLFDRCIYNNVDPEVLFKICS